MAGDALDDLLDYNANDNDIFRDVDTSMDVPSRRKPSPSAESNKNTSGLGIDEEIQVKKKRKPIVKLDDRRLLSSAGIPKLRLIAKERLRFKGKGHEYSDVARLLSMYQLWLDALYPRAKFADGLAIIEKLGHTKGMQTLRREWIYESKIQDKSDACLGHAENPALVEQKIPDSMKRSSTPSNAQQRKTATSNDINDNTIYSRTPGKHRKDWPSNDDPNDSLFLSDTEAENLPSGDELDALLAHRKTMDSSIGIGPPLQGRAERPNAEFEDEMEAMAGIDYM